MAKGELCLCSKKQMPHKRQAIRDFLENLLGDLVGGRVYKNRKPPLEEDAVYPLLLIYSGPERASRLTMPNMTSRDYAVVIEIRVSELNNVDDALDDLAQEVEDAMKEAGPLGGLVKAVTYTGADPQFDSEGETEMGSLILNYEFKYIS